MEISLDITLLPLAQYAYTLRCIAIYNRKFQGSLTLYERFVTETCVCLFNYIFLPKQQRCLWIWLVKCALLLEESCFPSLLNSFCPIKFLLGSCTRAISSDCQPNRLLVYQPFNIHTSSEWDIVSFICRITCKI